MKHPQGCIDQAVLDFARCQRPDGSYYGTGGKCRKGTEVGDKEKPAKKAKAKKKKAPDIDPEVAASEEMSVYAALDKNAPIMGEKITFDEQPALADHILDQHDSALPDESYANMYNSAKTASEKTDVMQRAAADFRNEAIVTERVRAQQQTDRKEINRAIRRLNQEKEKADMDILDRAMFTLDRAGYSNPTTAEAERLAMSWIGQEPGGFRSW